MDDKKILEKIKNSAENAEVPQSLFPEEIQKRLEAQQKKEQAAAEPPEAITEKKMKKVIPIWRYGAWAAAALLFLAAAFRISPLLKKQKQEIKVQESRGDTEAEAAEETAQDAEAEAAEETVQETVSHIESYEALYDMIKAYEEKQQTTDVDMAYDVQPFESPVDFAAEESADTGMGVRISADTNAEAAPETAESGYSQTNTQEKAVDEADIVKTDGTYIYALDEEGLLRIVEAENMELAGTIENDPDSDCLEMYVSGDVLQIIKSEETYVTYEEELELPEADAAPRSYYSVPLRKTVVMTYDISDRSKPEKTGSFYQDGEYLSSRKNGDYLYLFTTYSPQAGPTARAREYYVPRAGKGFVPYQDIYLPLKAEKNVYDGKRYLVASSIESSQPEKAKDCIAVVSGGETFYVSEQNVYAAASAWDGGEDKTDIVRFGYENGIFTPGCGGRIRGTLNNNFSMDEYEGNLRLVATVEAWTEESSGETAGSSLSRTNSLYVLNEDLQIIGKLEKLAEGEEIKSARFMGKTGYFVTYRNTDPLFSVDLSDPQKPEVLGELKITGFSEYLHFYGENKLLGIGWETDPDTGVTEGLKCSMFDLSDPSDVKETDRLILKDIWICDALSDYKAILADTEKNIFGFAYGISGSSNGTAGIYQEDSLTEQYYYGVFSYKEEGFVPLRYIKVSEGELYEGDMDYSDYRSLRGIYIGDVFYLVSSRGIESYDMADAFAPKSVLRWQE